MLFNKLLFSTIPFALLAGYASAADCAKNYPQQTNNFLCDGLIQPNWKDCDALGDSLIGKTLSAGPGCLVGTTKKKGNCQLRFVSCDGDAAKFSTDGSMVRQLMRNVHEYCPGNSGGAIRYGQACVVVESLKKQFERQGDVNGAIDQENIAVANETEPMRNSEEQKKVDILNEARKVRSLELSGSARRASRPVRRQCQGLTCRAYTEYSFSKNIRGKDYIFVCDSVLPHGAKCTQTRSHTTTQGLDIGFEVGAGIEGIISASASFTQTSSSAVTEELSTEIPVNCPKGKKKGYVVWYPYFEVSKGKCVAGYNSGCPGDNYCEPGREGACELWRPIRPNIKQPSGEYASMCV